MCTWQHSRQDRRLGKSRLAHTACERGGAPVGVAPEDVCDDHDRLLDHVVDLLLDEVQEHVDAALCRPLQRHRAAPNRAHSLFMVQLGQVAVSCSKHSTVKLRVVSCL